MVVLIEDDESFRRSTERLIKLGGFHVQSFRSAADFLESKRPDSVACLVLDVRLPGLSGLDLQSKLKRAGTEIPIVFITGHGDIPMSVNAMKAGAVEFLPKPFRHEKLLDAIRQAVDHRTKRREQAKPFLRLHRANDVDSFWVAVKSMIENAIPNSFVGLTLQHNPVLPTVTRWSRPIPDGQFNSKPIEKYLAAHPRTKFVQVSDVFTSESRLLKSDFYRQYMLPEKSRYGLGMFFWDGTKLVSVIVIMRTAKQHDFTDKQIALIRDLYFEFQIALRRIGALERDHAARIALQEFLSRLPLPTILLRWNLTVAYQNQAAREFCALWEQGPELATIMKATSPVPPEILDVCRSLKERWETAARVNPPRSLRSEIIHHPRWQHLRATISLKHLSAAGVARPQFLIECEDLRHDGSHGLPRAEANLAHLARLTPREQKLTHLVCQGCSNREIADRVGISVATVKKHLYGIFRKLEVTSRSRLMALMS
ncbi:MAG: hypothetical protein QOI34_1271 [Verrucomicrobiota bacterium]|jgi:FixJ family two-component response regulator